MNEKRIQIEFTEELRGKNALHFWVGLGIVAGLVYAWWHGWFSEGLFESGAMQRPESDGFGSGIGVMLIDTVCLIGFGGVTLSKLCWGFVKGLLERVGFVSSGITQWAAREQGGPDERVKQQAKINYHLAKSLEQRLADLERLTSDMDPPPPKTKDDIIAELRAELAATEPATSNEVSA